jgi:mycothiol synthase
MSIERIAPSDFAWTAETGPAADVRRIAAAAHAADGHDPLDEAARLTLRHRGLADGALFLAPGGFAWLHDRSSAGVAQLELVVAPSARGAGVGTTLARAALAEGPVTAWSHGHHPAAAALARKVGLEPVRELWVMRARLDASREVEVPEGFTLRAFRPGEDDAGVLAVNAAAFASHPEQGALDHAGLVERMAEPWFDPAGLLVARRDDQQDGEVLCLHWTKVHPASGDVPAYGEVYVIGVHPSTQGSGLGRALLVAGLEHLRSRGLDEVVLYVEGDNHGAIRLYESFGFAHSPADTHVLYA